MGDAGDLLASKSRTVDVRSAIAARSAEHREMLGQRIIELRQLAEDVANGNSQIAELAAMDQKIALLCNDLRDCVGREESMVFPALLRLSMQSSISRCQAGMVKARLRFMVAEQEALVAGLDEAATIARAHLSPAGPCESCHRLIAAIDSLQAELAVHLRLEQDKLFAWGIEKENALIARLDAIDDDPRCL